MSETKWTPGPWEAVEEDEGARYDIRSRPPAASQAAQWYIAKTYAGLRDPAATAHLIAAAPELYEALDDVLAWWRTDVDRYAAAHGETMTTRVMREGVQRANAALARARGEVAA